MSKRQNWLILLAAFLLFAGGCSQQPAAISQEQASQEFTLRTAMHDGKMVYLGTGGTIDGVVNPGLIVKQGDTVHITFINGDGMPHDLAIPDLGVRTSVMTSKDQATRVTFGAVENGTYTYYCTIAGHRQAGMEGNLIIEP